MGVLESVTGPRDLQGLSDDDLTLLASEIRDLLIRTVATNSGHLGPNLGVVGLTLAVHRGFDSPRDRIVFDTAHQSYVHKLLTGRVESFGTLRREGGLSGYPSQEESEHDIVENSHASTALSYADGLAKAYRIRGEDRHAVAIIGDGALTGGMAWEALNNIAIAKDSRLVIVVNDNGRSYTPTIGGLATALSSLRTDPRYENLLDMVKKRLNSVPGVGHAAYDALHAMKKGLKDALAPQGLFEDLGLKYVGPVDGHDRAAMETALTQAKRFGGPVIVHALTRKGYGYDPAERHEADQFHAPGPFDVQTGAEKPKGRIWTDHFSEAMVDLGHRRKDVVAITAAMMHPVGLDAFERHFPERTFDVGIAEQHAVTFCAGLASEGYRPFAAIYSTFLQRAYDQVVHDVAIQHLPVRFAIDRAGFVGADGPTHAGSFDVAFLASLPDMVVMAAGDEAELKHMVRTAAAYDEGPIAFRYPRGNGVGVEMPARGEILEIGKGRIIKEGSKVAILSLGSRLADAMTAARELDGFGLSTTVVDARFAKPIDTALIARLAREHEVLVTIEEGAVGGFGSLVMQFLAMNGLLDGGLKIRPMVMPDRFINHASPGGMIREAGLDTKAIVDTVFRALGTEASRQLQA